LLRKRARKPANSPRTLELARVLLVHGDLTPRLTLQTILQAGGYAVDVAATPAEAVTLMDQGQYELVLSGEAVSSRHLLAYARVKDYRPATATITSHEPMHRKPVKPTGYEVSIYTENVPHLLGGVAELIGLRAIRRYRPARQAV
jgi:hypothetical protein